MPGVRVQWRTLCPDLLAHDARGVPAELISQPLPDRDRSQRLHDKDTRTVTRCFRIGCGSTRDDRHQFRFNLSGPILGYHASIETEGHPIRNDVRADPALDQSESELRAAYPAPSPPRHKVRPDTGSDVITCLMVLMHAGVEVKA